MNFLRTVRAYATKAPTNLKGKSKSSQEWITRQLTDPYIEKAKVRNFDSFESMLTNKNGNFYQITSNITQFLNR